MISISRLLYGAVAPGDGLRYGDEKGYSKTTENDVGQRPIVVWNCTRRCNLHCVHCYANANDSIHANELSTPEAKSFIQDLSDFGVTVLLFSGGEPLLRVVLALTRSRATTWRRSPTAFTSQCVQTPLQPWPQVV